MRKLLFISYFYPPLNRCAARRSAGLTKYLPDFGWQPRVIASDWSKSPFADREELDERLTAAVVGMTPYPRNDFQGSTVVDHLRNYFDGKRVPLEWSQGAISLAEQILESEKIEVILATYPIISSFYIADYLSRRHKIPWVADMRDIAGEHPPANFLQNITIRRHIRWEKALLQSASNVAIISPGIFKETLEKRVGKEVDYISNGFDPEIFFPADNSKSEKFTLVYTGALGRTTDFTLLGKSLNDLFSGGQINPADVKIKFFGTAEEQVRRFFDYPEVWKIIEIIPWSEQSRIAKEQREATILLHASFRDLKGIMTGKIYEYLAAQRPIITLPGDNDVVDDLLTRIKAGVVCSREKVTKEYLLKFYREWKKTGLVEFSGDAAKIEEFSYKNLAGKIAKLLDEAWINR